MPAGGPGEAEPAERSVISLAITPGKCGTDNPEGYAVSIGRNVKVCNRRQRAQGVIWATKTLLQMAEQSTALPCGSIIDYPAFPHARGFMLDVACKYFADLLPRRPRQVLALLQDERFRSTSTTTACRSFLRTTVKTRQCFPDREQDLPGLASKDGYYTQTSANSRKSTRRLRRHCTARHHHPRDRYPGAHLLPFPHYALAGSDIYGKDHGPLQSRKATSSTPWREYLGRRSGVRRQKVHIGTDEYSNKDSLVVEQFRAFTDRLPPLRRVVRQGADALGRADPRQGRDPVKSDGILMNCCGNGYADPKEM